MTSPLTLPTFGHYTKIVGTPVYISTNADFYSVIIDTKKFSLRRIVDILEEERFKGLNVESLPELAIPEKVLDHPIVISSDDADTLLAIAQIMASATYDSVDDIIEIIDELADTISLADEEESDGIRLNDIRGVLGELLVLLGSLGLTADDEQRHKIVSSYHRGNGHDYDFDPPFGTPRDAKVFGTTNPYRVYLTPEELHRDDQAELMIIGLQTLDYDSAEGFTLQSLWTRVIDLLPRRYDDLEEWMEGYLNSSIADAHSFRILEAHPPMAINIGEIPGYEGLIGLESPYQNIREIPLHLEGAANLSEHSFEQALSDMGGT